LLVDRYHLPHYLRTALIIIGLIYLFAPATVVNPVEGYEARLMWETYEGFLYGNDPATRRSFLQNILLTLSGLTHLAPWSIWSSLVLILTPVSFFLTFGFVRHFRPVTLPTFILLTLAVPFWLVVVQFASDTSLAYPLVIGACYLSIRRRWWLPLSALLITLAIRTRADALPFIGIIPMIIWMDRGSLRDRTLDSAIFLISFAASSEILLSLHGVTPWQFLQSALGQSGSVIFTDWNVDNFFKVFNVNYLIVLPFIISGLYRSGRDRGIMHSLWLVIPIFLYLFAYRNLLTTPRYLTYVTPFILLLFIIGAEGALAWAGRFRWLRHPWAIPALVAILLFNPLLHIISAQRDNSSNLTERFSLNTEKMIYSRFSTGLLPGLNMIYKSNYAQCFRRIDGHIGEFLTSNKPAMVFFAWGNDSENNLHHRVFAGFYRHFNIPHDEAHTGTNLAVTRRAWRFEDPEADPEYHEVNAVSYQGKTLLMIKMRGYHSGADMFIREGRVLTRFMELAQTDQTAPKFQRSDFHKVVGYNLYTACYPRYLSAEHHCRIRDPYAAAVPASDGLPAVRAKLPEDWDFARTDPILPQLSAGDMERKAANEVWLKTIPDYEHKLYDRVRRLNSGIISIQRSHWLLVAIVLAGFGLLSWQIGRLKKGEPPSIGVWALWKRQHRLARRVGRMEKTLRQAAKDGSDEQISEPVIDELEKIANELRKHH